jgi:hypothetical protein
MSKQPFNIICRIHDDENYGKANNSRKPMQCYLNLKFHYLNLNVVNKIQESKALRERERERLQQEKVK